MGACNLYNLDGVQRLFFISVYDDLNEITPLHKTMLRPGKTKIYPCARTDPLNRTLVRTGTYGDGNCFVHAILTAIDPAYRKEKSAHGHAQRAKTFRQQLADWVTPERFRALGNGEPMRIHFMTALNGILDRDYETTPINPYNEVLHSVLPRATIDAEVIPGALNAANSGFYVAFLRATDTHVRAKMAPSVPAKHLEQFCGWMHKYFVECFERAHTLALDEFKARLARSGEFVDSLQMECIAHYTGYNFVFLHDDNDDNAPAYAGSEHVLAFDLDRQCLVFLWVHETHFEIVGELEHKNVINRVFNAGDPLIEALRHETAKN